LCPRDRAARPAFVRSIRALVEGFARRVGRGRARGVLGVLAQLLLEPLDPGLQAGDLALVACRQLDQELNAGIPAGVVDRFGLGALHAKRFAKRRLCPLPG
jgi:hypothetical protein